MGDWNDLVNVFNTGNNTVENILRLEEEKNTKDKAPQRDWNELVSNAANMEYMQALEATMAKYQAAMKSIFHAHINSNARALPLSYSRCAHPVLVEALSEISSRALVYHGWLRLVESEIVQGATRADSILHFTLNWFMNIYPRFNLNESILYGDRIQLFASLSNNAHASLPHATKEMIRVCLTQQPVRDLIQILLIDEPIPYDEIVRSLCASDFRDPDVEVEYRVHKALRDPATRTDTALALISMVKSFLSSRHPVNDIHKKIGWCLNCLFSNIKPFPLPATGIPPLLHYIDDILHHYPSKLEPQAKDLMANLKQVLTYMFDQKMMQASFSEPRYDIEIPKSTAPPKQQKEAEKTEKKDDLLLMARPNTARYHKEGYERVSLSASKIAHIEDVWIQVESIAPTKREGNFLTSVTRGHLVFNVNQVKSPTMLDWQLIHMYERITQHTGGTMKVEGGGGEGNPSASSIPSPSSPSSEQCYLYYFFPFSANELTELQRMLQDLCGKGPTHEIKYLLSK